MERRGQYENEMNLFESFVDDRCVVGMTESASAHDLYIAYREFGETSGEAVEGKRLFAGKLRDDGYEPHRGSGGVRMWRGLSVRTDEEQD